MKNHIKYPEKQDDFSRVEDLFNPLNVNAKPFLKWAGGKGQLLTSFQSLFPKELIENKIKNYYEPFLGSGAVFFHLVRTCTFHSAFLYDNNEDLILTYKVVRDNVTKLIDVLYSIQEKYLKLNTAGRRIFFYEQRDDFNRQRIKLSFENHRDKRLKRAAQMIFLNRTCFNGLYRVNSGGEFNTPAGKYKNPSICNEANLLNASRALRVAEIRKAEFREILKDIKPGSFIYFDPPYRPISKTANFSSYSRVTFGDNDQVELARIFKKLDTPGTKLMLSNSDPKNINPGDNFFDELYSEYHISRIPARRQINSIASRRGTISEIVVTNYPAAKVLQDKKL